MRIVHLIQVVALFAFLLVTSATHAVLINHWDFNEGSGTTAADSAGGAAGVIDGATWATDTGNRQNYLEFDGSNDRVDPSLSFPTITTADASSWTFWVNVNSGQTTANGIIIGNRRDGAGSDIGPGTRNFLKITPRGRFNFHQGGGKDTNFGAFPAEEWTHFAFSRDGDQLLLYVDGVEVNGGVATTINTLATEATGAVLPFYMGGEPGQGGSEHFAGGLDDVRLYDHALTPQEVLDSMLPILLGDPGDVNGDTFVNTDDLLIIRNNYFNTVTGTPEERFSAGDMNGDTIVDFRDYRIWKDNYVPPAGAASALVPEPTCLGLAVLGGCMFCGIRRRA